MFHYSANFSTVSYKVLCVGVNRDLKFAQKDAQDVAGLMASPLSMVPPHEVVCLLEPSITEMRRHLYRITQEAPTHFLLFFSGHGSPEGICLSDQTMRFGELARWLTAVQARHTFSILDTCHAGAFLEKGAVLGALAVDGIDLLARATPSSRVICSSAADRFSGEGMGVPNGHFTASFMAAMMVAPGDLGTRQGAWISDARIYKYTRRILKKQWGQEPVCRRLTGDFPVVRDHKDVVGSGAIVGTDFIDGTFQATIALSGRFALPTTVRVEALNRQGRQLAVFNQVMRASGNDDVRTYSLTFPPEQLMLDPESRLHFRLRQAAPIVWRASILDARGRMLDEDERLDWYRPRVSHRLIASW